MKVNVDRNAPVLQIKEILILESPEVIWNLLANIKDWNQWNSRIVCLEVERDLSVGSSFVWKNNGTKIKSHIHTIHPNEMLGWTGRVMGVHAVHNWFLEPVENGTMVRVEESMQGFLARILKKKMNQMLSQDMLFWLEQLKERAERK